MSLYEFVPPNGSIEFNNAEPGAIWLNPESEHAWQYRQSTSLMIKSVNCCKSGG